jgi:hypothetical protein
MSGVVGRLRPCGRARIIDVVNVLEDEKNNGLSHGEHHDILKSFLASSWTDDDRQRTDAKNAYTGSIGRWKKIITERDTMHAYYRFRDRSYDKTHRHGIGTFQLSECR